MPHLTIQNLHKSFGEIRALDGVSFELGQAEVVAVLGPSGCGKSTLLAVIAGLERPDKGRVLWDEISLEGVPTHQRSFGLMFQDYALFPHKNVWENVAFGLRMAGLEKVEVGHQVEQALDLVGLVGFGPRDVNLLSGGEQQRVALARSLAPRPRLLMLDEPLGSLDRALSERLLEELKVILKRTGKTALYVTHDQSEAFAIADRVVVMNAGRVEQIGAPDQIYRQPASLFVAKFLGFKNIFSGKVHVRDGMYTLVTEIGEIAIEATDKREATILMRPDRMRLDDSGEYSISGKVTTLTYQGAMSVVTLEVNGHTLKFEFASSVHLPGEGQQMRLSYNPKEAIQILT